MTKKKILGFLLLSFVFRFLYGWGSGFIHGEDHQFIYAMGLKFYTTGNWPYFGPDVVYTESQVPGALQGLWAGLPLLILPIPEAPYLVLTLAVVGSLGFLSWYLTRLDFALPKELIWLWVMTMPWSIFFGSIIINPTYVMIYAIGFMAGFYEIIRDRTVPPILPNSICYLIMGFTAIAIAQLHLSWVLLLPLIAGSWLVDYLREKKLSLGFSRVGYLLLGLFFGGLTLFPTFYRYGLGFTGGSEKNINFNPDNYKDLLKTFFNFIYFASYQVVTYFNLYSFDSELKRVLSQDWWLAPVFIIPFAFGLVQMILYTWGLWGLASLKDPRWLRIRLALVIVFFYTWLSFFFNDSGNSAHKYFLFFPLTVIYSVWVLEWAWPKKFFRYFYYLSFAMMLLGHVIIAFDARFVNPNPYFFYKVRAKISEAIEKRDYTLYSKTRYDYYFESNQEEKIRPGY